MAPKKSGGILSSAKFQFMLKESWTKKVDPLMEFHLISFKLPDWFFLDDDDDAQNKELLDEEQTSSSSSSSGKKAIADGSAGGSGAGVDPRQSKEMQKKQAAQQK